MTIVVFNSGILTIATESWCATEITDAAKPLVQVHVLGSPVRSQCNLDMPMVEFLALIEDRGRVLDLRGLQEPRHKSVSELARESVQRLADDLNARPGP